MKFEHLPAARTLTQYIAPNFREPKCNNCAHKLNVLVMRSPILVVKTVVMSSMTLKELCQVRYININVVSRVISAWAWTLQIIVENLQ